MSILNGYSAKKKAEVVQFDENSKHMMASKSIANTKKSDFEDTEERFIPPPIDTFNDLFENGKLSEMILSKRLMFMPFLPSGSIVQNENRRRLSAFHAFDDTDWNQQLNKWKDSITNDAQIESGDLCNDIPKIEDLAFKIPDNFDLV